MQGHSSDLGDVPFLQKPFVEFKAGMVKNESREGGTKLWLKADDRRGMLQLMRDAEGMMHLQWKDRISSATDFKRTVFPDEWIFSIVEQNSDARIVRMKFKQTASVTKDHFFWMQEAKNDKDQENIDKLNEYINDPSAAAAAAAAANAEESGPGGPGGFGGMDQQTLQQVSAPSLHLITAVIAKGDAHLAAARVRRGLRAELCGDLARALDRALGPIEVSIALSHHNSNDVQRWVVACFKVSTALSDNNSNEVWRWRANRPPRFQRRLVGRGHPDAALHAGPVGRGHPARHGDAAAAGGPEPNGSYRNLYQNCGMGWCRCHGYLLKWPRVTRTRAPRQAASTLEFPDVLNADTVAPLLSKCALHKFGNCCD